MIAWQANSASPAPHSRPLSFEFLDCSNDETGVQAMAVILFYSDRNRRAVVFHDATAETLSVFLARDVVHVLERRYGGPLGDLVIYDLRSPHPVFENVQIYRLANQRVVARITGVCSAEELSTTYGLIEREIQQLTTAGAAPYVPLRRLISASLLSQMKPEFTAIDVDWPGHDAQGVLVGNEKGLVLLHTLDHDRPTREVNDFLTHVVRNVEPVKSNPSLLVAERYAYAPADDPYLCSVNIEKGNGK